MVFLRILADYHHRAMRVCSTRGAHRAYELAEQAAVSPSADNKQLGVPAWGSQGGCQPPGKAQRRGRVFRTVDSDKDAFAIAHGSTFPQDPPCA
jgi:hypothetical protein